MSDERYIPLAGDYYVGTDGFSFLLVRRKTIQASAKTKKENIGKARFDTVGYYATLSGLVAGLHRHLSMDVLEESSASTLEEYVAELDARLKRVDALEKSMIKSLQKQMGVQDE